MQKTLLNQRTTGVTHKTVDNSVNISVKIKKSVDVLDFLMVLNKK